jgi:hypothetical protein
MKIRNENKYLSYLNPVGKYARPKYPVYAEACDNPELLKKLPSRWQKNANVIACIGLIGTATLTGCPPWGEVCSACGKMHHGGAGGAPVYVVFLTEQEALSLIREKAEKLGLNLNAAPPDYTVEIDRFFDTVKIGLDFFDEEKNVALSLVSLLESDWLWGRDSLNREVAKLAAEEFAKQENDISVGVLYNPGESPCLDPKTKEEIEKELRENLAGQVRQFIEGLQAQGIIQ